ncbi:MAG: F0F1 ATP synthase subunit B [Patescibacteria group bacterium]|jgi:F-type H+-transporting ATPase subunit b
MEELVKKFGIEPTLLLAQVINFGLVLFVLWKFAYKPVLKIMRERREKIAKSLDDAKAVEQKLAEAEELKKVKLKEARTEAQALMEATSVESERYRQERLKEIEAEMQQHRVQAQAQMQAEKAQAMQEAKAELVNLVMSATQKVVPSGVAKDLDKKLVAEAVEESQKS